MKIILTYPPVASHKGCPTIGQNRQFQYFKEPTFIYPVVPAQAATQLSNAGHQVLWLDCIAENISYERFTEIIKEEKPDLIALETKTPVITQHWGMINDLHNLKTNNWQLKTVLFGDHVTALPEESFEKCPVDFVLTGGDYDFLLLNLCNYLNERRNPVHSTGRNKSYAPEAARNSTAQSAVRNKSNTPEAALVSTNGERRIELEPGIYYRENGRIRNTGKFRLNHNLDSLPFIDRDLTRWRLYAYKNGNYKRTPGTYLMSARDCWWGRCSFCSWPTLYPEFRSRSTHNVLDEIGRLLERYHVREIMDDSGTFPIGDWLRGFCNGMIERGYHKRLYLDCNMRFGALSRQDLALMKEAGFRLLLFGLESANQKTLERIHKNVDVQRIIDDCRAASCAGLYPHITIMFGYPWEDYSDAVKTLALGQWLLRKGYAYTMQATVVIPYPGSPLFEECKNDGLLKTLDWEAYDMKGPVMKSPIPDHQLMELVQKMYTISFHPEFIMHKLFSIKDVDDIKYYSRAAGKVLGHILDFSNRKKCNACAEAEVGKKQGCPN